MKPEIVRCPTCGRRRTRTNNANARLWLLYHKIAEKIRPEGALYSAEQWHNYFKSRFLGCDDIKLPNKKVIHMPRSTADLSTVDFGEYMQQVEQWANEHGVYMDEMESLS